MENEEKRHWGMLGRFLFLDLLSDRKARPIFVYALVLIVLCSFLYRWLEGWSMLDAVYYVVITFATIGYGDLVPTRPLSKILTIFLALNGVAVLFMLFDEIQRMRRTQLHERWAEQKTQEEEKAAEEKDKAQAGG